VFMELLREVLRDKVNTDGHLGATVTMLRFFVNNEKEATI